MEKLKQEIWKKIPNHIGYEVSNLGRIRSYYNNGGKLCKEPHILRTIETEKGHIRVPIRKNKKPRIWFLHRLVLITFKGESILECNHKNGIKNDY